MFERTCWLIVLLVALIVAPVPLLASGAKQGTGDTQLYIGHAARLTARITAQLNLMHVSPP